MVSPLARGDYEDMIANGLKPTLEDFDRLNQLGNRLSSGGETTAANFPRIGWAGDVPFYQPTCQAFAWYLEYVSHASFDAATKDACWFFALAHGREENAFYGLISPRQISTAVDKWLSHLPVTRDEIARACRFASVGYEDAEPAKTDELKAEEAKKSEEDIRAESLEKLNDAIGEAAALTGITPKDLLIEIPSRLKKMIDAVRANNPMGGVQTSADVTKLQADYDLTRREIILRLTKERDEANG